MKGDVWRVELAADGAVWRHVAGNKMLFYIGISTILFNILREDEAACGPELMAAL